MKRKMLNRTIGAALAALLLFGNAAALAAEKSASKPPNWLIDLNGGDWTQNNGQQEDTKPVRKNMKVPILLYHHIPDEAFSGGNEISLISPYDFRMHMTAIKVNFTPISLRQYYQYVTCTDGSVTLPDNPIIVTFDDGYLSNYEIAYPILKELEIPATIFVVTDTVGAMAGDGKVNYSHFTWEQAKEMERSGLIEIQSHTASHVELASLPQEQLVLQLRKSKYMIEKNLGHPCDMIAFPYGSYTESVVNASKAAGYLLQARVDDKTSEEDFEVNLPSEGVDGLTRMTISGTMGNVNVIEIVRRAMAKKVVPTLDGWES